MAQRESKNKQLRVTEINGKKIRYIGMFHNAMVTKLPFLDRIKILFGCELVVQTINYTLQSQNRITGTDQQARVLPKYKIKKMFVDEKAKQEQKKTA